MKGVNLPFASKDSADYLGQKVAVMHACGHDSHVAILMGTAEVLAAMKKDIAGTVKFIFQPAEEGPPGDEEGRCTRNDKRRGDGQSHGRGGLWSAHCFFCGNRHH